MKEDKTEGSVECVWYTELHACEDNIKIDNKAKRWVGMDWIHLDQDRRT
jgi:hypothetical protein